MKEKTGLFCAACGCAIQGGVWHSQQVQLRFSNDLNENSPDKLRNSPITLPSAQVFQIDGSEGTILPPKSRVKLQKELDKFHLWHASKPWSCGAAAGALS